MSRRRHARRATLRQAGTLGPCATALVQALVVSALASACSLPQQGRDDPELTAANRDGPPAEARSAPSPADVLDDDGAPDEGSGASATPGVLDEDPGSAGRPLSTGSSFLATRLGQEVFAAADLAVVGRVLSVSRVGLGTGLLRVQVAENLMGDARPGSELMVLGFATDFVADSVEILFLRTFRGGPRFEVTRRIEGRDPDFRAKLDVIRRTARLLEIHTSADRDSAALQLVLDSLQDDASWTRRYGVAELAWVASTRSDLFTTVRRQMLVAIARDTTDPDVRAGVESVTITLERHPLSLPAAPGQESSSP